MRPEPLEEVSEPQAGIGRHTVVGYELVLNPWCRRWLNSWWKFRCLRSLWSTSHQRPLCPKLPRVEFIAPVPAVFQAPPVLEYIAPAPAIVQAPTPGVEYITPVPAVVQAPTPAVEYTLPPET